MTKNQINNLIFRQIEKKDLPQVYKLLNQLKQMDLKSIDQDKAWGSFSNNSSSNSLVGVFDDKIVAYGSVVIENKIRGEVCGHIEDIVVDKNLRKNMVGIRLVKELINICESKKCYRITLFCKEELINFYLRNGFKIDSINMKKYLNKD